MAKSQDNRRRRKKAAKKMQAWKRKQALRKIGQVASELLWDTMRMQSFARQLFSMEEREYSVLPRLTKRST
jgi:hypothetical protein